MESPFRIGNLTLSQNIEEADWVVAGVRPFSAHVVGSHVPQCFQAYARLFHPAYRSGGERREVRWADVARANKRQPHPAMEWASITGEWRFLQTGSQAGLWDQGPSQGSLPPRQAARLAQLLHHWTDTPDNCWFALWEGWAQLETPPGELPVVELPCRRMFLLAGPLSAIAASSRDFSASHLVNMWWPEDRAWFVSTDVDLLTTYIGGTAECIDRLTSDPGLEAMRIPSDQPVTWDADQVNPRPIGAPGPWKTGGTLNLQ